MDPGGGRATTAARSVTVSASTVMDADALATALYAVGPARASRLARGMRGFECLVVDDTGTATRTPGWRGARMKEGGA
jgi:thiamine biosynthesis lipoprotein